MSEYKPVKGDRVRVVLEGTADVNSAGYVTLVPDGQEAIPIGLSAPRLEEFSVSIEKIEPSVEVFKPGDRVRRKDSGYEYTLGDDGYLSHVDTPRGQWLPYADTVTQAAHWTSEKYELVAR